jgi:hypothetical protein
METIISKSAEDINRELYQMIKDWVNPLPVKIELVIEEENDREHEKFNER